MALPRSGEVDAAGIEFFFGLAWRDGAAGVSVADEAAVFGGKGWQAVDGLWPQWATVRADAPAVVFEVLPGVAAFAENGGLFIPKELDEGRHLLIHVDRFSNPPPGEKLEV